MKPTPVLLLAIAQSIIFVVYVAALIRYWLTQFFSRRKKSDSDQESH